MAKGADPFTVGVLSWSAAAAKITITRIAVIIISITIVSLLVIIIESSCQEKKISELLVVVAFVFCDLLCFDCVECFLNSNNSNFFEQFLNIQLSALTK